MQTLQNHFINRARQCRGVEGGKFKLADEIKDFVENQNPLNDTASFYQDILIWGIAQANYDEIAEAFLEMATE